MSERTQTASEATNQGQPTAFADIEDLKSQVASAKAGEATESERYAIAAARIHDLEKLLSDSQQENTALHFTNAQLKHRVSSHAAQLESVRASEREQVESLSRDLRALEEHHAALTEQHDDRVADIVALTAKHASDLSAAKGAYEADLAQKERDRLKMARAAASSDEVHTNAIRDLEQKLAEMRASNISAAQQHEERVADIVALTKKYRDDLAKIESAYWSYIGRVVKSGGDLLRSRLWNKKSAAEAFNRIIAEDVVDREWYLKCHPDVKAAGMDPVQHYLLYGSKEGRPARPFRITKNPSI